VVEVLTGLPPDPPPGAVPRPGFDPACTTLAERDRAKAAELGVTARTMQARRARYARQGLWGLVDQRAVRIAAAIGRADARLVAVVRDLVDAETDASTGTRSRLIRRAVKAVEAAHGPGVVPLPGRTTFYKVIDAAAAGRHTPLASAKPEPPESPPSRSRKASSTPDGCSRPRSPSAISLRASASWAEPQKKRGV
jgi:putative transposase